MRKKNLYFSLKKCIKKRGFFSKIFQKNILKNILFFFRFFKENMHFFLIPKKNQEKTFKKMFFWKNFEKTPYVLYVRTENRKSSKNHGKWTRTTSDYITNKVRMQNKWFVCIRDTQTALEQKITKN